MFIHRFARPALLVVVLVATSVVSSAAGASELTTYRAFTLGTPLDAVLASCAVPASELRTVVERPVLIQELTWRPSAVRNAAGESIRDSVSQVLFGFLNGELYRMVVSYDPDLTEGMTDQDLLEILSAEYGRGVTPASGAVIVMSSAAQGYDDEQPVVAKWENADASVTLFHTRVRSAFGIVLLSKPLAPLARSGLTRGLRLAMLDAPRRQAAEDLARREAEDRVHARARVANKAAFRY